LHFGKRRYALTSRKFLHERPLAADAIGKMDGRKRVAVRRIVRLHGTEILRDQKDRATGDRLPKARLLIGKWERLPVRPRDTEFLPSGDPSHPA
jgi:hypothetical protein